MTDRLTPPPAEAPRVPRTEAFAWHIPATPRFLMSHATLAIAGHSNGNESNVPVVVIDARDDAARTTALREAADALEALHTMSIPQYGPEADVRSLGALAARCRALAGPEAGR